VAFYTKYLCLFKYKLHLPYIKSLVCKKDRNNADIHVSSFQQTAGRRLKDEIKFYFVSMVAKFTWS
jgi:hypothetical protein